MTDRDHCSQFCPFVRDCPDCKFRGGKVSENPLQTSGFDAPQGKMGSAPKGAAPAGNRGLTKADLLGVEMAAPECTQNLDGCPECMARNNAPIRTTQLDPGVRCDYRCDTCGCTWHTSWWGVAV